MRSKLIYPELRASGPALCTSLTRHLAPQIPWKLAAPAALVSGAYLNGRWGLGQDLRTISSLVHFALKSSRYDRQKRASFFYRFEEFAQSKKDADRVWLIYEGQRWTFKEGYDLALKYGTWLKQTYGIAPQEIVALDFTNSPKMIFLMLGLWAIGAFPALINYNLTGKPLLHCIKTASARLVLVDDEIASKFSPEVREALALGDFMGEGKGSVDVTIVDAALEGKIALVQGVREPDTIWQGQGINEGNRMSSLIFTSGTTGFPKAAVVGWAKGYAAASFNHQWLGVRKNDVYYTCMPLYHGTATVMGLMSSMILGNTVAIGHKFSTKTFWPDVRDSKATIIQYVGETCRYLLVAPPQIDPETGENLDKQNTVRAAFGNGLRPDVWERFRERFGIETIAEFYSATEGAGALFNLSNNAFSSGAIGRGGPLGRIMSKIMGRGLAIVYLDWATEEPWRDPANGNFCVPVAAGTAGELLYRVDANDLEANYLGYYNNQKASSSKILRDVFVKGDAWFRTGDTIKFDDEGRAFFIDRIGDTFRWRSENVSTAEVSEVLGMHPAISEANVYGVELPHHEGRAGCAAITLNSGWEMSKDLLRDIAVHAQKSLPKFAVPLFLRLTKELEATGNNKQQKVGLRTEGVDPEKVGAEDRLFWLRGAAYEDYGLGEWERIRKGEVRL